MGDSNRGSRQHQAEKLEAMIRLAQGIANDLDALVFGVLQHADQALRGMSRDDPLREPIAAIVSSVRRSAELCQNLRAFSGREELTKAPVNLSELVDEMADLLALSVSSETNIHLDIGDTVPMIMADATQLQQVILNLVVNASESSGDANEVEIAVSVGEAAVEEETFAESCLHGTISPGAYVFLRIADTGKGMTEEEKSKLFDPFYKITNRGGGLGLSAALGIVRGHDGAISVDSSPGRGSAVTAFFPALEDSLSAVVEPPASAPPWRGEGTVLIVDDEPNARKLAQLFLEEVGFKVLIAEDGRDGLSVFREHVDDIVAVVLDLTMPNMGGEETFEQLRKIRADVPVILSSGFSEQDVTDRFSGQPWAGFIQKPYRFAALVFKLKEIIALRV